ncbi:MAG: hypothetical protein IIY42_05890, partial [Ruminococcus sp.]|nr:hypothetical protein [Ruminococcus sp.]
MKKALALLLAVCVIASLVACSGGKKESATEKSDTDTKKSGYQVSEDVPEGSVIDGVMTYIDGEDPVLKKTVAPWLDTCVLYEVNVRQYTEEGTFKAFEA